MTTVRMQLSETWRGKRRELATASIADPAATKRMTEFVAAETVRTELERHGLCDDAWVLIDSEAGWPMHKKLAVLKYFWRVTSTLEWKALNRFDTEVIRELTAGAGDGYDRHMARPKSRRERRLRDDAGTDGGPVTLASIGRYDQGE